MPAALTQTPPSVRPAPFRWTAEMFHDVCDAGFFEGRNVILVGGEIFEMPPRTRRTTSG